MVDTLFGLIPAASLGQQWVAEELQLVNWGGYDGPHRIRFSSAATLLCGGSGSGKSTLMDAYIALMMPHTTPFNGASNGGVTGRPRGADQRNILSYGRGKLDEARTAEGTKVRVLRGDGTDTWTAVAMTWADHDGRRFTALRAWYIPASARTLEDTVRVRATADGAFDLLALEPAARQRLSDARVRAAGLETLATDREFSARLHSILGIGAAGAGQKAMSLLARIQAGQQITTVDELYKRMVLEEPETLATADAVVEHFDGLEGTRGRMLTARQQVAALRPVRGLRTRLEAAAERLRLLDEVGNFADPDSLASLWRATRRLDLLRQAETEMRARKQRLDAVVAEKEAAVRAAESERDALADVLRTSGGDRLDTAERERRAADVRLTQVRANRERLDDALRVLDARADSAGEFATLSQRATATVGDADARTFARDHYASAREKARGVQREVDALEAEHRRVQRRRDNIPERLHEARELMADAAGLSPQDLPFVGELLEVRTEFEPWRAAFNVALGGFATTLLVDADRLGALRAAIDSTRLPVRVSFEGVPLGLPVHTTLDDRTLPGRLDLRRTPFSGWLQQRLEERFGFVCVDSATDLGRHAKAITITGQVSQGNRGSHGGMSRGNVLGFSSQRRLDDLAAQIDDARRRLVDVLDALAAAEGALDSLDEQRTAFQTVLGFTWEQVDVAAAETECERWQAIIDEVATGDPQVAELRARITRAREKVTFLTEDVGRAKLDRERVEQRWADLIDDVDAADAVVEESGDADRALSAEQAAHLDSYVAPVDSDGPAKPLEELKRFDAAVALASERLAADRTATQATLVEQREALARTLATFLERWPNPNLLPDPDRSVADFERILGDLEASGLHELEGEWRDSLLKLSGNDLTNLDSVLGRSLREIRERIQPINDIMADLPFYDDHHRLQITIRETQSVVRQRFRKELRDVRALIDAAASDEDREQVYERMSRLINRLRRSSPDFADLVDVRNHVRVSAERVHAATGEHVSLYDHIGEKSGGESQELIAFIVGAALRYQLGDAGAERPRYAPVFLDEALIKADAHFTRRAIGAWRGLGFQLIIGAPNDKYSAIEPHVDVEYDILKDTQGRSWAKPKVGLPQE